MEIPQFNSPELKNATIVKSSITAPDIDDNTIDTIKDNIKQLLAKKNYKLINAFDHSSMSLSPCLDEKQLFKTLFESLRNQLVRSTDEKNAEKLLLINKVFESILSLLDILASQKVSLDRDVVLASFLGILIKSL
jgi:hypothetical protein